MIRRTHELLAAAAKAWSDFMEVANRSRESAGEDEASALVPVAEGQPVPLAPGARGLILPRSPVQHRRTVPDRMRSRVVRVICRATQTEPCHICRMITYNVTVTGPLGFQVSVFGPYLRDARLIGDFRSSQEADAFVDRMGAEIDAGRSYVASFPGHGPRLRCGGGRPREPRSDRSQPCDVAAAKARSDVRATLLKAEQRREQARVTGTTLICLSPSFHWREE